ncbi:helix-turn-helix domain-containing protein [Herbiconiux ginsengi]|uniref:Helix-turn-helix n=1 Tax=Herbiconiux ginsengi TaxID=381665 RepID=A0A1H3TT71_9MICO|nr:helix-turn-helix transcriptional regulator [Herbiconiux ginsengi]SDZ52529.1 Helix-turn-helix [Herbiconiux ginsengi]
MSSVRSEAARVLGERVRDERQRFAISQWDLAELSGVHFTNIGRVERGESNPTFVTILRIADALNLNPAVLVDGLTADMLPDRAHRITVADLIRARGTGTAS